jgi:pimeloyl-ACP methyl ester carboxylesterase
MLIDANGKGYFIQARPDLRLHVVTDGPPSRPLIIFLHGFPEFWWSWRRQLPFFAELGYRTVAVDLRGVNYSDKPKGGYDPSTQAGDILGLLDELGGQQAILVGHDYGGFIAYVFALLYPDRLKKLVILNTLPPALWPNPKSAEFRHFARLVRLGYETINPLLSIVNQGFGLGAIMKPLAHNRQALPQSVRRAYSQAYARSGKTAVAYAPAFVEWLAKSLPKDLQIDHPALVLWSANDFTAPFRLTEHIPQSLPQAQIVKIERAGHWLQQEQALAVNEAIWAFLQA